MRSFLKISSKKFVVYFPLDKFSPELQKRFKEKPSLILSKERMTKLMDVIARYSKSALSAYGGFMSTPAAWQSYLGRPDSVVLRVVTDDPILSKDIAIISRSTDVAPFSPVYVTFIPSYFVWWRKSAPGFELLGFDDFEALKQRMLSPRLENVLQNVLNKIGTGPSVAGVGRLSRARFVDRVNAMDFEHQVEIVHKDRARKYFAPAPIDGKNRSRSAMVKGAHRQQQRALLLQQRGQKAREREAIKHGDTKGRDKLYHMARSKRRKIIKGLMAAEFQAARDNKQNITREEALRRALRKYKSDPEFRQQARLKKDTVFGVVAPDYTPF